MRNESKRLFNKQIMILACSGASNAGQLSNQAAVELAREGFGKMLCLAGVWRPSVVNCPVSERRDCIGSHRRGCPVACVKKIFEHAEVLLKAYVAITDLGIEKKPVTNLKRDGAERVKSAEKDACNQYKADWSKYGAIQ